MHAIFQVTGFIFTWTFTGTMISWFLVAYDISTISLVWKLSDLLINILHHTMNTLNEMPGAGVLVLRCGHISHIVKMHYFFNNLSSLLPVIDQTNYVYSIDDQGPYINMYCQGGGSN